MISLFTEGIQTHSIKLKWTLVSFYFMTTLYTNTVIRFVYDYFNLYFTNLYTQPQFLIDDCVTK